MTNGILVQINQPQRAPMIGRILSQSASERSRSGSSFRLSPKGTMSKDHPGSDLRRKSPEESIASLDKGSLDPHSGGVESLDLEHSVFSKSAQDKYVPGKFMIDRSKMATQVSEISDVSSLSSRFTQASIDRRGASSCESDVYAPTQKKEWCTNSHHIFKIWQKRWSFWWHILAYSFVENFLLRLLGCYSFFLKSIEESIVTFFNSFWGAWGFVNDQILGFLVVRFPILHPYENTTQVSFCMAVMEWFLSCPCLMDFSDCRISLLSQNIAIALWTLSIVVKVSVLALDDTFDDTALETIYCSFKGKLLCIWCMHQQVFDVWCLLFQDLPRVWFRITST